MTVTSPVVLEPAAQQVADAFSKPPFLYDMTPADARKVLQDAQSGPVSKLPVDEEWITVPAQVGEARVRLIKPHGATGMLPVIVYTHGGGRRVGRRRHERRAGADGQGTRRRHLRAAVDVLPGDRRGDEHRLLSATVRFDGTIHDFMLLNSRSESRATRAAIGQATAFLRAGLGTA